MRPATIVLLCALPLGAGCVREGNQETGAGLHAAPQELDLFERTVRETARERAHTAVALAAGPDQLAWGVAVSAPTADAAKTIAMSRCVSRVRQGRVGAPCAVYAVDGRPLFLDRE